MKIDEKIRADLWKAIQAHYERNDFTESVRDTVFHICEVLRDKSGLSDKDGSKLVDEALLGKNPLVMINKNETTTEKTIQQGVGFAFKGIMQAIRDPLSHEKVDLSEKEAEAIILYSNYLLNQVDRSQSISKIGEIRDLLYDEDFTDTEEYAKCLIKEVPAKKRYDLLIDLYNERVLLPENRLRFFLTELINSLSKISFEEFIRIVSNSLIKCKDDKALRMYFHYFMGLTYEKVDKLAQLRIEALIKKSIQNGKLEPYINGMYSGKRCNSEGSLATWASGKIWLFNSNEELVNLLYLKMLNKADEIEYVSRFFAKDLLRDGMSFKPIEESIIKEQLLNGNQYIYDAINSSISLPIEEDELAVRFSKELEKCRELLWGDEDIPF